MGKNYQVAAKGLAKWEKRTGQEKKKKAAKPASKPSQSGGLTTTINSIESFLNPTTKSGWKFSPGTNLKSIKIKKKF